MRPWIAAVLLLAACKSDEHPRTVCEWKVAKDVECGVMAKEDRTYERNFCATVLAGASTNEKLAFAKTRYDHDAMCAKKSSTCAAYEACVETYDLVKARDETAAAFKAKK